MSINRISMNKIIIKLMCDKFFVTFACKIKVHTVQISTD